MFRIPNRANSRFKQPGFPLFGGKPFRPGDLFAGASANDGYLGTDPQTKYQTTVSPWTAADDVTDPVGLMLSRLGDGRGVVNILLNTATLSTQNVTTLAQDYTLFFSGAGTVELSGTATLAASPAGTYTFTASAGTLTVTVTGTVTSAQINAGTTALAYQENTYTVGGPGIHASQSTAGSRPTIASIPRGGRRNQFASTTSTFTTRNFTTLAVQYTLSFRGTGTVTLTGTSTAGPLVGTGANDRVSLTFTPSAGTLTLTVSGSVLDAQIEFGATATAYQNVTSNFLVTESGVPQREIEYLDGLDWWTLGTQSFRTASFFAGAGQQWWVAGVFSTFATSGTVLAKCGAVDANRTLQVLVNPGTQRALVYSRGTSQDASASAINDGGLHVWLLVWDGTDLNFYIDTAAAFECGVGAAAEESQNITIGARTASSPAAFFTGYNKIIGFGDRALTSTEISQLMANLNSYWRGA